MPDTTVHGIGFRGDTATCVCGWTVTVDPDPEFWRNRALTPLVEEHMGWKPGRIDAFPNPPKDGQVTETPWRVGTTRTGHLNHVYPHDGLHPVCGNGGDLYSEASDVLPLCARCEALPRCETCTAFGPYSGEAGWWHRPGCPLNDTGATDA